MAEHLRRWYEPSFGRPHALSEPQVACDGERVVVTGSVFDELVGMPRTVIYTVTDGECAALTCDTGSARWARFSPDGDRLAFLADRAEAGVLQLYLLDGDLREAVAAPSVEGTVEHAEWSPDGRHIVMMVAGFGAELAGTQGSGSNVPITPNLPDWHPLVENSAKDEAAWQRLWLYDLPTNAVARISPESRRLTRRASRVGCSTRSCWWVIFVGRASGSCCVTSLRRTNRCGNRWRGGSSPPTVFRRAPRSSSSWCSGAGSDRVVGPR